MFGNTGEVSLFVGVDHHAKSNNYVHHTNEISVDQLIVRRGKPFKLTLSLKKAFRLLNQPIIMSAMTGKYPTEELGTFSSFSIPDFIRRSPDAKAVWKIEILEDNTEKAGKLTVSITPPPDCPVGEFIIMVKHMEEETLLAMPVVLFNPWCSEDTVFLEDETERKEYVMNETGIIFRGSPDYIMPLDWDFGQFEADMVNICMKLLDLNPKYAENPAEDVASRSDPLYVGRLVSAMVNSNGDYGVLQGRWSGDYEGGKRPGFWTGSHQILKKWFNNNFARVQFGQCWVFAGVMCSVMRLLGIPTRVITNFASAHDTNQSLTIDIYHTKEGVSEKPTLDSIWNYHVWTESWMKRTDLSKDGTYDGWQVLDPTPQEMSDGAYCCGPASVNAILKGETPFPYDVPFVFAEVNADVIDWLVKADRSEVKLDSDTKKVGKNISTKAVGTDKRVDVTDKYKPKEGSEKERTVFKYAVTIDYSSGGLDDGREDLGDEDTGDDDDVVDEIDADDEDEPTQPTLLPVTIRFDEVTKPTNGKDVRMKLVLTSKSTTARPLTVTISVQVMRYNGTITGNVKNEEKELLLQPKKALLVPLRITFSEYRKYMVESDSLKISVMVTDKENPEHTYLAEDDIVLRDPPITVRVKGSVRQYQMVTGEVVFMNPIKETLTNCSLTLTGSGLWADEREVKMPDLDENQRVTVAFNFIPYKAGEKTLVADFDCSAFRDIKGHCKVNVRPLYYS